MRDRLGLGIVFGLGTGQFALHFIHALGEGENAWTFLYGIMIPMLFSLGLVIGGTWLWRTEQDAEARLRIGKWCLIGAVALGFGAWLTILYQQAESIHMSDRPFIIINQTSIGSVVGFIVGIYQVRQRTARARAEQLSERLTVVNRVLRHDLRNGANIIHGWAGMLNDQLDDPKQAEAIQREATDLVELGNHARSIEYLLCEDQDLDTIDVVSVIETRLDRVTDIHPDVEIDTSLGSKAQAKAHPLIETALANVLDNAVKHNDKATPQITVECDHVTDGGDEYVEIRIGDNGPGIPDGELAVLERGYETQLEHTMGLGLWLVNWIVRESGGEIRFEDNSPEGSIVAIRLEAATTKTSPAVTTQ